MTGTKRARLAVVADPWAAYLEAIRNGSTEREAAALAGVSRTTIHRWTHADEAKAQAEDEARTAYLESRRAIVESIARGEVEDARVANVQLAAATWLLSKRDPDRFGDRRKVESTTVTATVEAPATDATRLAELVEEARRRLGQ